MNLSKDLSDTFNEKMQQTHDAKDLDGEWLRLSSCLGSCSSLSV
jgi:hypothetical protein